MERTPTYFAVIPANVRYDNTLTPNAKLLYAEISALCNMNGKCKASTQYFCKLYNVSKVSIQKWLKQLEAKNHINRKVIYRKGSKEILHRYITIVNEDYNLLVNKGRKEKLIDNNNISILNNNITYSNNKGISQLLKEVEDFDTTDQHKKDFLEYWLETNQRGKTRFQMEKTWSTNRRLKNWIRNYNNWWSKNNKGKIDRQLSEFEKGKKYL